MALYKINTLHFVSHRRLRALLGRGPCQGITVASLTST